jgi:anaerobic magnesium-protoporphyrin IX monomethyl ester cyclase
MDEANDDKLLAGVDLHHSIDAIFINSPLKNYDHAKRYNDFTLPVLGLGYIATYAQQQGLNVAVLDAEANGVGISRIIELVRRHKPRWVGLNLLAPTYRYSIEILQGIDTDVKVMLGGHQAKAMPDTILMDEHITRIDALILGEAEYRTAAILKNIDSRETLPHVYWRSDEGRGQRRQSSLAADANKHYWLAPDINTLPFINREFLVQDPFTTREGIIEANLVGSRGCPYDCAFCGAALSANRDISIRTRSARNIIEEMQYLNEKKKVTAFRFVDDLFLASPRFMKEWTSAFRESGIGNRWSWDATGRINILAKVGDQMLDEVRDTGCREIALGIESGSERVLQYMGKRIDTSMTVKVVDDLTKRGINVKGYFIFGYPTETRADLDQSIELIKQLWDISDGNEGTFRCSVFEFRPYPGTPEWERIMRSGRYRTKDLLRYESVDLTQEGNLDEMLDRDEFNFSVNMQFGDVPIPEVRQELSKIMIEQKRRLLVPQKEQKNTSHNELQHVNEPKDTPESDVLEPDHVQRMNLAARL